MLQFTNFGKPTMAVYDGNYDNKGELLLGHHYNGVMLDLEQATRTLERVYELWGHPVNLKTIVKEIDERDAEIARRRDREPEPEEQGKSSVTTVTEFEMPATRRGTKSKTSPRRTWTTTRNRTSGRVIEEFIFAAIDHHFVSLVLERCVDGDIAVVRQSLKRVDVDGLGEDGSQFGRVRVLNVGQRPCERHGYRIRCRSVHRPVRLVRLVHRRVTLSNGFPIRERGRHLRRGVVLSQPNVPVQGFAFDGRGNHLAVAFENAGVGQLRQMDVMEGDVNPLSLVLAHRSRPFPLGDSLCDCRDGCGVGDFAEITTDEPSPWCPEECQEDVGGNIIAIVASSWRFGSI